jgi:hypothetical protein
MNCQRCGGTKRGKLSGGISVPSSLNKRPGVISAGISANRYCTCDFGPANRYTDTGTVPFVAGMPGKIPDSNISYRAALSNNSDVIFLAGLIVGAVVGILVVGALVLVF